MKKILFFWEELKATFWFFPVLIILIGIMMASGFIYLDTEFEKPDKWNQVILVKSADSARTILSTIAAAMITVAGTVFSITLVALTIASNQFGSRLVKRFMYDRINQVVLGTYVATFLYALLVLSVIRDNDNILFIPAFSVLFSLVISVGNILLLIIFIHHVSVSIQVDRIIADLFKTISSNIKSLFPEDMGEDRGDAKVWSQEEIVREMTLTHSEEILSPDSGYLQYVDSEGLIKELLEKNQFLSLYFRPGKYLVKEQKIGEIHSKGKLDKKDLEFIRKSLVIGKTRTHQQDAEFSIDQMVEVATRALSPGINDPYTAMTCVDNLTSSLCYLSKVKFPSSYRRDKNGQIRVITDCLTFEGMVNASFNQIRQFSAQVPSVLIRMMDGFITLDGFAKNEEQKKIIRKHAKMVADLAKNSFNENNDIEDLLKRYKKLI
ncbi:DUF2254 domain-containing protein [Pararhodonellum marinum]|uniref:DUF2254 domain-containing protein n=1 Tax=Pararhodonellum marinum TaxID=2755358 RepID=UPI00188E04E1|nr:DUF2254 domain-containing protein [Pararhodonellum marinum]